MAKKKDTCETCYFFHFELIEAPRQGTCTRFPPHGDAWAQVKLVDIACNEYKLKEKTNG